MIIYFYIFGGVFFVSALSLLGLVFLSFSPRFIAQITLPLVSLSAGALLGDSFLHLLPEATEKNGASLSVWLWLIAGLIFFFILEKIIHWRHCHILTSPTHPHPLGIMNLVGDACHNFFDGLVIAGSFLVSVPLGIATLIAVVAHEIPHEIGNYSVLIYAGYSRLKALFFNFLTALTAVLGAIVAVLSGANPNAFSVWLIPLTAGGFIYIATADLIPELKKETAAGQSLIQLIFILLGIGLMLALKLIFK